jgi:hypothetical protein
MDGLSSRSYSVSKTIILSGTRRKFPVFVTVHVSGEAETTRMSVKTVSATIDLSPME